MPNLRLPEGDLPVIAGDGTSKSAASRRFVALSAERLAEWMTSDLSKLDLLVIQIDGLHIGNDLVLECEAYNRVYEQSYGSS